MFPIIKSSSYDSLINKFIYYFYFIFQFFFVISGSAIVRNDVRIYKFITLFMIIPFIFIIIFDFYYFLRGKFTNLELVVYTFIGIIFLLSLYNYRNVMVFANIILISAFKDTDGKKALKYYCYATVIAFIITLITGLIWPNLGNVTQVRNGVERVRYGLGFFYCSLGQFYFLSIVLAYILIKEKLKLYEYFVFAIIDIVLFVFTDTKAPFAYVILALFLFFLIDKIKNRFFLKIFGIITILSFLLSFITMFTMSWIFTYDNKILFFINRMVNGRLSLSHNALVRYGFKLFGQNVQEVLHDSTCYLDSSMMTILVLHGVLVTIISLVFMTYFSYISYKAKKNVILVVLFIVAFRATFDLGFMAIQFSPVVLLFMPTLREYLSDKKK